jgi:hypothetical protein
MFHWFLFFSMIAGSWFAGPLLPGSPAQRIVNQGGYQRTTFSRPKLQATTTTSGGTQNYQPLCCGPNPPPPPREDGP